MTSVNNNSNVNTYAGAGGAAAFGIGGYWAGAKLSGPAQDVGTATGSWAGGKIRTFLPGEGPIAAAWAARTGKLGKTNPAIAAHWVRRMQQVLTGENAEQGAKEIGKAIGVKPATARTGAKVAKVVVQEGLGAAHAVAVGTGAGKAASLGAKVGGAVAGGLIGYALLSNAADAVG